MVSRATCLNISPEVRKPWRVMSPGAESRGRLNIQRLLCHRVSNILQLSPEKTSNICYIAFLIEAVYDRIYVIYKCILLKNVNILQINVKCFVKSQSVLVSFN